MLSVGKLAAGPNAGRYYEDAVALGREDYYAGEGKRPGRWVGGGAGGLGLSGEVSEGQVGHLLSGEDPASGELLGRPMDEGSVAGFDLTFNAPKSVGLAFAIGDPWTARVLSECHERAVNDALGYLEREACRARRGKGGLHVIEGKGFAAAAFDHRTSRAGDPLLHTHVVVSNRTLGEDGRWTALDARPLYRHAKTAGYLYQARLRHEVTKRLGARWGPVRKGAADLHGFSRKLVEHFSRRRAEILEALELHGTQSLLAANTAALETRKRKDHSTPFPRLREEWRARAAEHGLTQERVEELLTRRWRELARPGDIDLAELTRKRSTFTRRDILQAICEAHPDGAPTIEELEARADQSLRGPEIVRIADPAGTRYTTQAQLDLERGLLDSATRRQEAGVAEADSKRLEKAVTGRGLSAEQEHAVRELTASGRGVEVLRAPAGAGKTYALDAAREAWQASGIDVTGCALSAHAARELHDQAGIETTTIADLKQRLEHGAQLEPRSVLIVDEAGMVGTHDLAFLAKHAVQSQAKLLLVGDDRQLPEIDAGGAFRVIAERNGAVELTAVRRQDHDWDRDALRALREGKAADWAEAYVDHGRVITADTAPSLREQLAADWWEAARDGGDVRMIALRRADVTDLNTRARNIMRAHGRFIGPDVEFADKGYAIGDTIVVGRNDRRLGVLNGDRARVLDAQETHIDIRLDRADTIRLPSTFLDDGHVDHGYATTAHKAQGATVDQAFVLGSRETYREWGYTALSRHRDQARFYVTAPKDFLNAEPTQLNDPEQLKLFLEATFEDSRRHTLALEALDNTQPKLIPEQRRRLHEVLPGLDVPVEMPRPEPPDPDLDIGMDFGM
jgi:Ti-type conjugative transfer relaxase TraA